MPVPVFYGPCRLSFPVPDALFVLIQHLLPKRALTAFAGYCANATWSPWVRNVIPWFIGRYNVNMAEAAEPDHRQYRTFNEFLRGRSSPMPARWPMCRGCARWTAPSAR